MESTLRDLKRVGKDFIVEVYPEVGLLGEPTAVTVPTALCRSCKNEHSLIIMNIQFKPKFKSKGIVYCECLVCKSTTTVYVRDMKGIMIGDDGKEPSED